jgi:hypothetical protein
MFEEFSAGYYLGRLYVEPTEADEVAAPAAIHEDIHEWANEQLYATGEGLERLDLPLVMKLGRTHFPVSGAEDVPARTLAVPEALLDRETCDAPGLCEVFLAKADRATQLLKTAGWEPNDTAAA